MNFRDSIRMHRLAVMRQRRVEAARRAALKSIAERLAAAASKGCNCDLCSGRDGRTLAEVMRAIAASSLDIEPPPEAKH